MLCKNVLSMMCWYQTIISYYKIHFYIIYNLFLYFYRIFRRSPPRGTISINKARWRYFRKNPSIYRHKPKVGPTIPPRSVFTEGQWIDPFIKHRYLHYLQHILLSLYICQLSIFTSQPLDFLYIYLHQRSLLHSSSQL